MKVILNMTLAIALMISNTAFGSNNNDNLVEKARETVAQAAPDDWETLAKAADKCIRKGKNLKEANDWVSQSLQIKETVYNLQVMGDYYLKAKMPRQAIIYYVMSMKLATKLNHLADNSTTQYKVNKALALQAKIG